MHLVIVTPPGLGHLRPIFFFADELLKVDGRLTVTIFTLMMESQVAERIPACLSDRMKVCVIFETENRLSKDAYYAQNADKFVSQFVQYIDDNKLPKPTVHIFDMVFGWSTALGQVYNIPSYVFLSGSLRVTYLMGLLSKEPEMLRALKGGVLNLSEKENLVTSDMHCVNRPELHTAATNWLSCSGVVSNDVEGLSTQTLIDKFCALGDKPSFKVFPVGPVGIFTNSELKWSGASASPSGRDETLEWLDGFEPNSVVFVAFGSWAEIPVQDICELAHALKALDSPVLWAYRGKVNPDKAPSWVSNRETQDAVAEDGLPVNFRASLDASKFRITPWVEQRQVLAHPAVRVFVSHCGWNSTLEAIALAGKPIATLPIGGDQAVNARDLCTQFNMAKQLWDSGSTRKLERRQVEADLRDIMHNPDKAEQAAKWQQVVRESKIPETGSSWKNMLKFVESVSGASPQRD
eukprot:Gregarina_sp_Pseudo_9__844@NODE_1540_length_1510_cov_172_582597_g1427_i0_p1_GENE_NODE_1540_length_1510_cov_172_582597_g1427_i0NODE_1540_length_1510_cov_172_582597_g1427_i0_p1_ORF_typecomplete_len464_score112_72UDPGT/PF00201_18/2_9e40Glyco_tran_28_C/PF04101_16/0_00036Amidohydro_2/PF04909_14/0_026Transposase_mut/PF00872_18/3_7e03Transposase_mut/PF00872_18/0_17_NODE_1540_length_1510_cov_172_582597_g1427_i0611452